MTSSQCTEQSYFANNKYVLNSFLVSFSDFTHLGFPVISYKHHRLRSSFFFVVSDYFLSNLVAVLVFIYIVS